MSNNQNEELHTWPIEPDPLPISDRTENGFTTRARPKELRIPAWASHYSANLEHADEITYSRTVNGWLQVRQREQVNLSCEGVEWWQYDPELYLQLASEERGRKIWVQLPLAGIDELINDLQQAKELLQADQGQHPSS